MLVVDSAKRLSNAGHAPFRLADLVAEVQRLDPSRGRGSIQPVVQGMTINAGKGPEAPCGKVLERVQHGYYRLAEGLTPVPVLERGDQPARRVGHRTARTVGIVEKDLRNRLDGLVAEFDACAEHYDRLFPFTRRGQYKRHRQTIDRRRAVGSAEAAATDDLFTELLHSTLQAWGIGRRASRLAPLDEFRRGLSDRAPELAQLDQLTLEDPALEISEVTKVLDRLVQELGVVDNRARIVAGTKTLHHLLPDLVPPMDRAWTGAFFGWRLLDPQNRQTEIFSKAFASLYGVAVAAGPSRLVGAGWRTSLTKILDNAVIGYCQLHAIGGTARSG